MARIAFVLPVRGGSGGAHSVVQEVTALRALGVEAQVLVNRANAAQFASAYDRFDWVAQGGMGVFDGPKDLALLAAEAEVVIGTTNTSVHSINEALQTMRNPTLRTGYYVQDYEPLFYAAGSSEHRLAVASFALLPNCVYFAKTNWLTGIVHAAHGLDAVRVVPSIDHGLYHPAPRASGRRLVAAMVRPATPRRAPRRTLRLMARLAEGEFGDVEVVGFGAEAEEMEEAGLAVPQGVRMLGRLRQQDVAALMRAADVFLDLSDYQAFGRTAAEAMACGCVALAPRLGGAGDFIDDGVSGFLVDTTDTAAVSAALHSILSLSEAELRGMRYAGLEAVSGFTPVRAAMSEMRALGLA